MTNKNTTNQQSECDKPVAHFDYVFQGPWLQYWRTHEDTKEWQLLSKGYLECGYDMLDAGYKNLSANDILFQAEVIKEQRRLEKEASNAALNARNAALTQRVREMEEMLKDVQKTIQFELCDGDVIAQEWDRLHDKLAAMLSDSDEGKKGNL